MAPLVLLFWRGRRQTLREVWGRFRIPSRRLSSRCRAMAGDLIPLIDILDALADEFIVSSDGVLYKHLNAALDGCHYYSLGGQGECVRQLRRNVVPDQGFLLPEKAQFDFQSH